MEVGKPQTAVKAILARFGRLNWVLFVLSLILAGAIILGELTLNHVDPNKPYFYRTYSVAFWFMSYCFLVGAIAAPIFKLRIKRQAISIVISSVVIFVVLFGVLVFLGAKRLAMLPGDSTLISVIVTTVITLLMLFVKFQIDASVRRTTHSLDVLLQMRLSEVYNKHVERVNRVFPSGQKAVISDSDIKKSINFVTHELYESRENNKRDIMLFEAIKSQAYILNYFEFLALGIRNLTLDEEILYQSLGGIFIRTYEQSQNLVEHSGDKKTFCEIKALYLVWNERRKKDLELLK